MSLDFLNDKQHFSNNQPPTEKKFLAVYLLEKTYDKNLQYNLQSSKDRKQAKEVFQWNEPSRGGNKRTDGGYDPRICWNGISAIFTHLVRRHLL